MDQGHTDEVADRYGEIRCPVQLLWGVEDQWIPLETGRRLAALLPGERFIEVPEAGHLRPLPFLNPMGGFAFAATTAKPRGPAAGEL